MIPPVTSSITPKTDEPITPPNPLDLKFANHPSLPSEYYS